MARGSVSTHSSAGTSADSDVYAKMLKTVGSSMVGRNVTVETICFRISRISACIWLSGLLGALRISASHQSTSLGRNEIPSTYGASDSSVLV